MCCESGFSLMNLVKKQIPILNARGSFMWPNDVEHEWTISDGIWSYKSCKSILLQQQNYTHGHKRLNKE
jgi:hypothetical protein